MPLKKRKFLIRQIKYMVENGLMYFPRFTHNFYFLVSSRCFSQRFTKRKTRLYQVQWPMDQILMGLLKISLHHLDLLHDQFLIQETRWLQAIKMNQWNKNDVNIFLMSWFEYWKTHEKHITDFPPAKRIHSRKCK